MTSVILKGLLLGAFSISALSPVASAAASLAAARKRMPATAHVSYTAVLTFKKGSNELSASDRAQLEALFAQIKKLSQKIEQAHVASWGDRAPVKAPQAAKLAGAPQAKPSEAVLSDRELAESRADAVEGHLEHVYNLSLIETYNMSERGNYFARAFSLPSADVKKLFANPGAPQTVTPEDFALVKLKGGAGRAVVLIEVDPTSIVSE